MNFGGLGTVIERDWSDDDRGLIFLHADTFLRYACVITSQRDASILSSYVFVTVAAVCLRDKHLVDSLRDHCKKQARAPHHPREESSNTSIDDNIPTVCHNCETDRAVYQCLHADCNGAGTCTNVCALCTECDRVLHKAVAKRSHIRIPLQPTDDLIRCVLLEGTKTPPTHTYNMCFDSLLLHHT
jgi:hypothetical protein